MSNFEKYLQNKLASATYGNERQLLEEELAKIKNCTERNKNQQKMAQLKSDPSKLDKAGILEYLILARDLCEEEELVDLDDYIYKIIDDEYIEQVMYYLEKKHGKGKTTAPRISNTLIALKLQSCNFLQILPYLCFYATKEVEATIDCNLENLVLIPDTFLQAMSSWQYQSLCNIIAKKISKSQNIKIDIETLNRSAALGPICDSILEILPNMLETLNIGNISFLESKNKDSINQILELIATSLKNPTYCVMPKPIAIDEETAEFCITRTKTTVNKLQLLNSFPNIWNRLPKDFAKTLSSKEVGQLFTIKTPNWDFFRQILSEVQDEECKHELCQDLQTFFYRKDIPEEIISQILKIKWNKPIRSTIAVALLATRQIGTSFKFRKQDIAKYVESNYKDNTDLCLLLPKYATHIAAVTLVRQAASPWSSDRVTDVSNKVILYAAENLNLVSVLLQNNKNNELLDKIPAKYFQSTPRIVTKATNENISYLINKNIKWGNTKGIISTNIIDYYLDASQYRVCIALLEKKVKPSKHSAAKIQKLMFDRLEYRENTYTEELLCASLSLPNQPRIKAEDIRKLFIKKCHSAILKLVADGRLSRGATFEGLPIMCHLFSYENIYTAISLGMNPLDGGARSPMFKKEIPLAQRTELFEIYLNNRIAKHDLIQTIIEPCEVSMF